MGVLMMKPATLSDICMHDDWNVNPDGMGQVISDRLWTGQLRKSQGSILRLQLRSRVSYGATYM